MTVRFVFSPTANGPQPFEETAVEFKWNPGMAPSQKRKNVAALHEAARTHGFKNLLEISSKSELEIGRRLSAFNLKIDIAGRRTSFENLYQGSKVFSGSGPHPEWLDLEPREARRAARNPELGKLIGFSYLGERYSSSSRLFYDWIYIRTLLPHEAWIRSNINFDGFTDIEFNQKVSVSCQARAFAIFLGLMARGTLHSSAQSLSELERNCPLTI